MIEKDFNQWIRKNVTYYFFNFFLDDLLIERYNDYQNEEHEKILKKNKESDLRHYSNMEKLNEENEKIEKENEEKAFKKYCGLVSFKKII